MFDLSMLTISQFTENDVLHRVFDEKQYQNRGAQLVQELETYQFFPKAEINSRLTTLLQKQIEVLYTGVSFTSIPEEGVTQCILEHDVCIPYADQMDGVRNLYVSSDIPLEVLEEIAMNLWEYKLQYHWITATELERWRTGGYCFLTNKGVLFKRIVLDAMEQGATDIHFQPCYENRKPCVYVKYRINNDLLPCTLFTLQPAETDSLLSYVIQQYTSSLALDLNQSSGVTNSIDDVFGDGKVAIRLSAEKAVAGIYCVCRIQQEKTFNFTIETLGFNKEVQKVLRQLATKRSGLTLITGSIRTGKNTTAFALANELQKEPVNVVSYESPIEVLMPFPQIAYNGNAEMLLHAISNAKKQDINVAFLNEIPNRQVAFAVQDLINSSVHVITTLHLNRIYQLPYKLREYYAEEYKNIISQINAVINQKMYSCMCQHCLEHTTIDTFKDTMFYAALLKSGLHSVPFTRGCEHCNWTGKDGGRVQPYVEYLYFTDQLKLELMKCGNPSEMEQVMRRAIQEDGNSLEEQLFSAIRNDLLDVRSLGTLF